MNYLVYIVGFTSGENKGAEVFLFYKESLWTEVQRKYSLSGIRWGSIENYGNMLLKIVTF